MKVWIFYFLFPAILMLSSWEARAQCFAGAADFTTNTTGNDWSAGTHWIGGVSPGCDLNVVNRKVEVRSNTTVFSATCATLLMSAASTSLHVTNNSTLTIQGAFLLEDEFVCIFVETGSALIVQGNFTLNSASATITVAGSMQVVGTFDIANELATINVSGSLSANTLIYSGIDNTFTNSGTTTISTTLQAGALTNGNRLVNASTGIVNVGNIDLNNGDFIINNSGTINQSGNFIDIAAGSGFNNLATGTWNWSLTPNTTYDPDVSTILNCSAVGNTFNYNGAGAQRIIPVSYQNLTLSNSGAKSANNVSFSVGGNWLVSGTATFTAGTATITLNGTGAQTITNPAGETFNNLVINNTSATSPQITLNNPVTVTTTLTMTDGNVNLNGNLFTLSSAASGALSHNLLSTAGWMYGGSIIRSFSDSPAIAVGNVDGFFPLGGSSQFRPFFIGKSSELFNSNGTITVSHTDAETATDISFTDNTIPVSAGTVTIQRRHDSFWTVAKSAGISAGTFDLMAGGTGFNIGAIGDVRLTRVSNTTDIGTAVATTGTAADVRANRTGINIALTGVLNTNFYIASTNSVASPLPIVLAYYRLRLQGDEVISSWKTLQEKNNHFFTVQKTIDFETFYEVGTLEGKGTTQEEQTYSFIDDSPFIGKSYYRLKQTDFDGKFTFSDLVMIHYQGSSPVLKAYPNPFSGKHISIELKGLKDIPVVPVHIYNQQGLKIMEMMLHEMGPGIIKEEIIFPVKLPQGLYIIKAGKTLEMTRKIIVN